MGKSKIIKQIQTTCKGVEVTGQIVKYSKLHFSIEILQPYQGISEGIFKPGVPDQVAYIGSEEGNKMVIAQLEKIYNICHSMVLKSKVLKQELEWYDKETCDMVIDIESARRELIKIHNKSDHASAASEDLKKSAALRREIMKISSIISEKANSRLSKHIYSSPGITPEIIEFMRKL
ncbi:MAG: hypothetical protein U0W24_16725 [Bacteroidales bacterium]